MADSRTTPMKEHFNTTCENSMKNELREPLLYEILSPSFQGLGFRYKRYSKEPSPQNTS